MRKHAIQFCNVTMTRFMGSRKVRRALDTSGTRALSAVTDPMRAAQAAREAGSSVFFVTLSRAELAIGAALVFKTALRSRFALLILLAITAKTRKG